MRDSLQARLRARVEEEPERPGLGLLGRDGNCTWRTRGELYERARAYGSTLVEHGLKPGDVCCLVLPSEELGCLCLLATLLVGARPVLVAPPVVRGLHSNLKAVLEHVVTKTDARVVVGSREDGDLAVELAPRFTATAFLFDQAIFDRQDSSGVELAFPDESDTAALQLTSGTTGFPRVCVWSQKGVLAGLDGMWEAMRASADDVCFNWTPLYHDMGLVNNFLLCLCQGLPLVMLPTTDFIRRPALWLRGLSSTASTITWSPNFGFALAAGRIKEQELEGVRLEHVRAFWNAAERIHAETTEVFQRRFADIGVRPEALKTNFGCAENVGGATFSDVDGLSKLDRLDRRRLFEDGVATPVSGSETQDGVVSVVGVGRPYPGLSIEILSAEGKPLGERQVGEIALRTPSRMMGYLDDPDATHRALHGDLLRTGDFGYMSDGELFWTGRVTERITLFGRKYDPSDFEPVLLNVPGLRKGCFAAFGVDDSELGTQRLVIVAETSESLEGSRATIEEQIREQVLRQVGATVGDVVLLAKGTMSKTSSGKRRHRHYRHLYEEGRLGPSIKNGE